MTERPILFSAPMVRAILDGTKTQTRRVMKPQPFGDRSDDDVRADMVARGAMSPDDSLRALVNGAMHAGFIEGIRWQYGQPGDRLWVREAWRVGKPHDHRSPTVVVERMREHQTLGPRGVTVLYQAGGWRSVGPPGRDEPNYPDDEPMPAWAGKRRPSIHMPRVFSRITLDVSNVRVERLQDISDADAIAEGISEFVGGWICREATDDRPMQAGATPQEGYRHLWDSINGTGAWEANPWVWVITFRRLA